ncbi:hypothetical protein FKM82_018331 [Ascaphus truei]
MGLRLSLVLLVTSSGRAGGSWFRATSKMAPLLPGHSCDAYPGGGHFGRRLSPVRRCVRPLLFPAHRSLPAPAVHCGFPPSRAASPSCVGGRHHQKGGEVRYAVREEEEVGIVVQVHQSRTDIGSKVISYFK